jgi:predicted component of type VI protein secretion system
VAAPIPFRRPRHDTTPVIAIVIAVGLILAGLLVYQTVRSQDRYSTLRTAQTTGQAQRTDQQQLTCALWAILRDSTSQKLTASMRQAADRICSTVPTPTPSN